MKIQIFTILLIIVQFGSWTISVRADISIGHPSGFQRMKDVETWVSNADTDTECKIEIEKHYLEHPMNPVAMKRFMSFEQPRLRELGFPIIQFPPHQNFDEQEVYRARFDGSSADGMRSITVLLVGENLRLIVVRIKSIGQTKEHHQKIVEQVQEKFIVRKEPIQITRE